MACSGYDRGCVTEGSSHNKELSGANSSAEFEKLYINLQSLELLICFCHYLMNVFFPVAP